MCSFVFYLKKKAVGIHLNCSFSTCLYVKPLEAMVLTGAGQERGTGFCPNPHNINSWGVGSGFIRDDSCRIPSRHPNCNAVCPFLGMGIGNWSAPVSWACVLHGLVGTCASYPCNLHLCSSAGVCQQVFSRWWVSRGTVYFCWWFGSVQEYVWLGDFLFFF